MVPSFRYSFIKRKVVDGVSERGGHPVYRKPMKQWVLKITEYADRLLEDLDDLDWPESIKDMQRNWIGRSEGAKVSFNVEDTDNKIDVFTTRPDTIFTSFLVLSPEHSLVNSITSEDKRRSQSLSKASKKSDLERTDLAKRKKQAFSQVMQLILFLVKLPIWIADYVLSTYGTGAVMAVPGHDERDHEFAKI